MTAIDKSQSTIDQLNKYVDSNVLKENMNYTEEDVERLFSEIEYYNEGKDGTTKLEGQIKNLEQRLAELQKRADELQNEIAEIDDKNKVKQEELVKLTALIIGEEGEYQEDVEKAAQEALDEALAKYKESGGKGDFNDFYSEAFQSKASEFNAHEIIIKNWTSQAESQKSKINDLTGIIQSYLIQTNALKGELNTTCSTISMLTRTKNNMSDTIIGAYKNIDTDTNTPVFSGRKADVANKLLETYQSRYTVTKNETKSDAEKAAEQKELQNKFIGQKQGTYVAETVVDGKTKKNDIYNKTSNPELTNLGELIEGGMLEELKNAGMNTSDIMYFISANWKIGLKTPEDNNGSWGIPYGHGTTGHRDANEKFAQDADGTSKIYDALRELFDVDDTEKAKTADSVNQAQMQELEKAVKQDNILTTMYEAGFTYKEMMYTLCALFPDAGIEYTVSDQNEGQNPVNKDDKADTRHYKIVKDSDASGNLYKKISEEILNKWNVGGTEITEDKPETPADPSENIDPMTFIKDGKTFTFVEDRNNNKKFDYKDGNNNDLLGSKDGIYELLQYDYNKDGVIDNKDIVTDENGNKVQMTLVDGSKRDKTALDMLTLMINDQTESIDNSEDINNYKGAQNYKDKGKLTNSVDFDITYTSAYELGIDSIDLTGLNAGRDGEKLATGEERFNNDKVYDGFQEEYEDINGSSVINRFGITFKGGESVTANETLNSKENLETFYKQVADRTDINTEKIFSSFDVDTVNNSFIYGKDRTGELNLDAIDNIVKDQITVDGKNMDLGDFVKGLDKQIGNMEKMLEAKLQNSQSADNESLDELLGSIETTLEWIQEQKEEEETPPPPPPTEPEDNPNPDPPVETKPAEPTPTEPEPEPTPTEPEPEPTVPEPEPEPTPTEPEPEPTPTVPDCEPEDDILPDMFDDTKRKLEE